MALNPGNTLSNGQYRIIRLLGRGGYGSVYLAQDTLMGEEVAIKEEQRVDQRSFAKCHGVGSLAALAP